MDRLKSYLVFASLFSTPTLAEPAGVALGKEWVANDGSHLLVFSAEGLPPGVTIDRKTGVISGIISRAAPWKSSDVFTVLVSFHNSAGAVGKTKIDIRPVNSPPVAVDDEVELVGGKGVPLQIDALINDSDPDEDTLTLIAARSDHGTVVTASEGIMLYLPNERSRDGTIDYHVGDGHGGVASARVTIKSKD